MLSSSIDLSEFPADLAGDIAHMINRYERRKEQEATWQHVLDNGTEAEIMEKVVPDVRPLTPMILACDCPPNDDERYARIREIVPYEFQSHPRRPVAMRGGRLVRYWKYRLSTGSLNPNGWAIQVFKRALRMSKVTLLDQREIYDYTDKLVGRIASKHPAVTATFRQSCDRRPYRYKYSASDYIEVLIAGKFTELSRSEYTNIERLHKIIKKTDKLDERLRLARESRRY